MWIEIRAKRDGKGVEASEMENGTSEINVRWKEPPLKKGTNHPVFNNDILCNACESARVPRSDSSLPLYLSSLFLFLILFLFPKYFVGKLCS